MEKTDSWVFRVHENIEFPSIKVRPCLVKSELNLFECRFGFRNLPELDRICATINTSRFLSESNEKMWLRVEVPLILRLCRAFGAMTYPLCFGHHATSTARRHYDQIEPRCLRCSAVS